VQLIYTIGHSTRELTDFLALLRENGIKRLADIRRYPGSRRYPHFSKEALAKSLAEYGIEYVHFEDLGGRRKPLGDSPNTAIRNEQFRAYADYMATPEFHAAVDRLLASDLRTAYMCAEGVPWRCHRNLLSDEMVRRGIKVVHILGHGERREHERNSIARVEGDHVTYQVDASEGSPSPARRAAPRRSRSRS
jgi:uncharacterized protein (DUF488 family)